MPAPHDCQQCPLCYYRNRVVNGIVVGDNPKLLIVGEGPGIGEDTKGVPFIGPTGEILKQELALRGIKSYALTNATRCYPGEDKKESEMSEALAACNTYLLQDIATLQPKVILALGAYAVKALGFDDPINTILCHVLDGPYGVPVIPSYHPAAFMRGAGNLHLFETAVYKAFRVLNDLPLQEQWHPTILTRDEFFQCGGGFKITIDTETTSKDPKKADVVIAQITHDKGTLVVTPNKAWDALVSIWNDPQYEVNFQNGDYDIQVLERAIGPMRCQYVHDTMLAAHLLHEESNYHLELLRGVHTNQPVYERPIRKWKDEVIEIPYTTLKKPTKAQVAAGVTEPIPTLRYRKQKRGKDLDGYQSVPLDMLTEYGVYDSQTEHLIWKEHEKILTPQQKELLQEVVLPMQVALMEMERNGIYVDGERIPEVRDYYLKRSDELAKKVFEGADEEFKISSPVDVKRVLFDELGLPKPPIKSKKTGVVSSGKKALDWLSTHANHPVVHALEEWRANEQMLKAFLGKPDKDGNIPKGLMSNIENGKLHTTFRMTLETGRNSSSPNLQNLPTLSKGPIRELFIAAPGNVLLQADYSQIELRIAAYESGDNLLIDLLESGGDVHTIFARRLYPFEPNLSDKEWKDKYDSYRTLAKRFTFGRLFGQGEEGMALTFNISKEEAFRFQAVYSELFPGMAAWWDSTINTVRSGANLVTKWGRERRFPAFTKFANINWRGRAGLFSHMEREALNFIPQGSAADALSKATGNLRKLINKFNLPMILRLVVHDSLTIECAKEYMHKAAAILKAEMEVVGERFGWRLPVEVKWGRTWAGEGGKL